MNIPVLIRSGGEMASGIAHRLHQCHMKVLIRAMLHDVVETHAGMKLGDVDPRGERGYVDTISDKARAIGGGVPEAILHSYPSLKIPA